MTEQLKTLKDLKKEHKEDCADCEGYPESITSTFSEELKQEAVKWIKELQENKLAYKFRGTETNIFPLWIQGSEKEVIDWIKYFFNISDNDIEDFEMNEKEREMFWRDAER